MTFNYREALDKAKQRVNDDISTLERDWLFGEQSSECVMTDSITNDLREQGTCPKCSCNGLVRVTATGATETLSGFQCCNYQCRYLFLQASKGCFPNHYIPIKMANELVSFLEVKVVMPKSRNLKNDHIISWFEACPFLGKWMPFFREKYLQPIAIKFNNDYTVDTAGFSDVHAQDQFIDEENARIAKEAEKV